MTAHWPPATPVNVNVTGELFTLLPLAGDTVKMLASVATFVDSAVAVLVCIGLTSTGGCGSNPIVEYTAASGYSTVNNVAYVASTTNVCGVGLPR